MGKILNKTFKKPSNFAFCCAGELQPRPNVKNQRQKQDRLEKHQDFHPPFIDDFPSYTPAFNLGASQLAMFDYRKDLFISHLWQQTCPSDPVTGDILSLGSTMWDSKIAKRADNYKN